MRRGLPISWRKSPRGRIGLWQMEHHTHNGAAPSHGFKVGVAPVAVAKLYEFLLQADVAAVKATWEAEEEQVARVREMFEDDAEVAERGVEETKAKYLPREEI